MAGKASKASVAEIEPTSTAPPASDAPDEEIDDATSILKTEEGQLPVADAEAASAHPEAVNADINAAKPSTDAAQDDSGSRASSESDERIATSPSKKLNNKSRKGGRASRGKSSSSKRSSEEQEATKGNADDASKAVDPSVSTSAPNDVDATPPTKDLEIASNALEPGAQPSSAPIAEAATESSNATSNGHDDIQSKNGATSKELAQLGLGSFGDGGDEEVVGPRRSRRGPGASPDLRAREPKTEPDIDEAPLQGPASTEIEDIHTYPHATVDGDSFNFATESTEDTKAAARTSTVPEEAVGEAHTDAKAEVDDQQESAPEAQAANAFSHADAGDEGAEDAELDYAEADDQVDLDGEEAGDEAGDEGVTRCVCGSADENVGLMIQCETCKCWQHCVCMGMQVEEDCPDVYYCEQCRPELHIPLLRSLGLLPKASKKGSGKNAKYSTRELKEAKEAIAMLAQENARRTQAAEAAAAYNSRERKGSANSRNEAAKEVPKSPKRRSTMNSRDSAYGGWEPIPPGLLADGEVWEGADDKKGGKKRKRGLPDDSTDSVAEDPEPGEGAADAISDAPKRRRMSAGAADQEGDAEMDEDDPARAADHSASTARDKSSKKKKGNNQYTVREASVTADASASKPRHPNQYTYRKDRNGAAVPNGQKTGSSSTSNLTSHSPSPSPSKGKTENARRAAAREGGSQVGTPAPGDAIGTSSRGGHQTSSIQWGLPEHLIHLAYLLPHSGPLPATARGTGSAIENGSANGGKKTATVSGHTSSGTSPPAGAAFPTPFRVVSSIESSTKVRFPSRRMTMGEMRKRVRNIGEYVTRSQIEAVEREKRMKLLGIVPPYLDEMEEGAETGPEAMHDDGSDTTAGATAEATTEPSLEKETNEGEATDASAAHKEEQLPLSMRLMEELTRELINFQRKFGVGPGSHGSLSGSYQSAVVH